MIFVVVVNTGCGENTAVHSADLVNAVLQWCGSNIVSTAQPVFLFFSLLLFFLVLALFLQEVAAVLDRRFLSGQCLC